MTSTGTTDPDPPGTVALFPLNTVLFVGGKLPLRIFETRYVDMVRRCLREDTGFGVVLLRSGDEARRTPDAAVPEVHSQGTVARIRDFSQLDDGLLGILCEGERRFSIKRRWQQADHLMLAEVDYLPEEPSQPVQNRHGPLVELLEQLLAHPMVAKLELPVDLADARSVSWRLAELLPVQPSVKQMLLELPDPEQRMAALEQVLEQIQGSDSSR